MPIKIQKKLETRRWKSTNKKAKRVTINEPPEKDDDEDSSEEEEEDDDEENLSVDEWYKKIQEKSI